MTADEAKMKTQEVVAARHAVHDPTAAHVGIGLRQPHYDALLRQRPALGFVEVHSENFFADGGAALAVLQAAREC